MVKKSFCLIFFIGFLCGYFSFAWGADRGEIHSGETKSGTILASSFMDTRTFYGQAGDRVIIDARVTSGTPELLINLYPPDGGPSEAFSFWKVDHQLHW